MTKNPFAKKSTEEVKVEPGYVKVMFSYMRSDKNRAAKGEKYPSVTNGFTEGGTRFYYTKLMGGLYSLPGRVVEAQDINFILKDGTRTNVSDNLIGQTLNVRIDQDEFDALVMEADECERGIGIEVVFYVGTGLVDIGTLTLTSTTGETVRSYTVSGELVEDAVEECLGTIVSDKLDLDELNEYFNQSAAKANKEANEARLANQAARQSMGNAADLTAAIEAAAEL